MENAAASSEAGPNESLARKGHLRVLGFNRADHYAALSSNELANDSSPAATSVVGDGIVRSIARKIDLAFFRQHHPVRPERTAIAAGGRSTSGGAPLILRRGVPAA
jgi:hypothetical protein